jgi:predicted ATPase
VKGFDEPVQVWRLMTLLDASPAARWLFVGRQSELHQLKEALAACCQMAHGQAVYLRGEGGIGKTRLVEELQREAAVAGFTCRKGHVLDFGAGKARDAIRSLARSLLGIEPEAGQEAMRQAADVAAVSVADIIADPRVFLYDLLDLPQPPNLRALYSTMDNATRNCGKRETIAEIVKSKSRQQPLLLVVEDVHWADGLTLDHLAKLTETVADCAALLIMTSHLDGDPLDQAWRRQIGDSRC